jgi:hypothetical protein
VSIFFSCSSGPDEEVTWGMVNKQFVELEKEKIKIFDILMDKPQKTTK